MSASPLKPLAGQRVLVTRAAEDCEAWAKRLREAGAEPVILPCIACETIEEPGIGDRLVDALGRSDWVAFTSRRGVDAFVRLVGEAANALPAAIRVAVVGPATAEAATTLLGRVDLVADAGTAESLARALAARLAAEPAATRRVLIVVAENAGTVLEDTLAAAGADCTRVDGYRTVPSGADGAKRPLSALGADKILLASPSAVAGLLNQVELDQVAEIFTIGPSTTRAARAAALDVTAEATRPSLQGLMETMQ